MLNAAFGLAYQPHFRSSVQNHRKLPGHIPSKIAKQMIQQCVKDWRQKKEQQQVQTQWLTQFVVTGLPINDHVINPQVRINL